MRKLFALKFILFLLAYLSKRVGKKFPWGGGITEKKYEDKQKRSKIALLASSRGGGGQWRS